MYPKRTLPLELVQNIGGQAAISDVKSLRLACKTFAALLAEDLFYCLVIDISRRDVQQQHRGFEILASLVSAESHPAWTATRELSIQQINLDEPSWQVASCLIPALKSLRNLTKIRPVIPRISGLEISGITNTTDLQPCDGNRMGVLISFLSNPQISLLETFAISSHGQGLESHIGSPLVTAATGVIDKSRHNLKSLAFVFPFARPTPTPPTIQCVFGPSTLRASFPVLTHLIMAEEIIYNIRSSTRTVPQFSSLKHLTCISREQMRPPSLIADSRPNTFDFWTALANTGVRLHSIKDATATHEMLHYLKSYSGELQELRIKRFRIRYEADKWQGLGEEFWNHVIPLHDTSLRLLHVQTNCNGWWSFGPVTQHVFSIYPFPQLEELKINIDTMAHGTLAEEKYMILPFNHDSLLRSGS
ncbi:hypothetical protein FA15DRAFT_389564 [Coprinopsis marcescibilis]|uniref:F-box domain-containing protein n=1 Tax=Coprinopsis marcescibilis TaxID=230819 RepID=A0A5C3L9A2_COPMA|nr:hypothetical protein FA15DRAFT_389564 [Coprinopsis marcescibilis]